MSTFDADAFMDEAYEEETSTSIPPVPAGVYMGIVEDVAVREGTDKNGDEYKALDVVWSILDEELKAQLDREKIVVRQSFFLDLNPQGKMDFGEGKNVRLGRLRDALNQNAAGRRWSLRDMIGGTASINVTQRPAKDDPDTIYNDVSRVMAA